MSERDYEALGKRLRDARQSLRLDIRTAASALHIRPRYLQAMEDGELSLLPGDTFAAGYVARYAQYLGLNPDEMVEAFGEAGVLPPRRMFTIPDSMRTDDHPSPQLLLMTLVAVLVAMMFLPARVHTPHFLTQVVKPPMERLPEPLKEING